MDIKIKTVYRNGAFRGGYVKLPWNVRNRGAWTRSTNLCKIRMEGNWCNIVTSLMTNHANYFKVHMKGIIRKELDVYNDKKNV